jgi:hypothetical protein
MFNFVLVSYEEQFTQNTFYLLGLSESQISVDKQRKY